jgi:hypothetical protein
MTINRNLSILAEGASSSGVLGTANGGTGLTTIGTNGQVLQSNGSSLIFATPSTTSPAGSTGQVQYNNAGVFGAVSAGTSGQVLTSAGSGSVPTWTTPSAGAMTLISTQNVSGVTSISWTGLSGYNNYLLLFEGVYGVIAADSIAMQYGYGATPTYITSGYFYADTQVYINGSAGTNYNASAADSQFYIGIVYPTYGSNGAFYLNGMTSATSQNTPSMLGKSNYIQTSSRFSAFDYSGALITSNAITAIKIYSPSYSNNLAGKASLYGISS